MAENTNKPQSQPNPPTVKESKAKTPQNKTTKTVRKPRVRYSEDGQKAEKGERYSNA